MRFEKVSYNQFANSVNSGEKIDVNTIYENIKLPKRATRFSAGYDFYAPFDFTLKAGETIKIPTGIRVLLYNDTFLAIYPRSSLGFKYRIQLDNTVGIIDSDYYNSDNEGHIFVKITNDSRDGKDLIIKQGEAIVQGIIQQYYTVIDDDTDEIRNGGIGSTNSN